MLKDALNCSRQRGRCKRLLQIWLDAERPAGASGVSVSRRSGAVLEILGRFLAQNKISDVERFGENLRLDGKTRT